MIVKAAYQLSSLVEKILVQGVSADTLPQLASLKSGKTYADFVAVWKNLLPGSMHGLSFEQMVAACARTLFAADVIAESFVPDDEF